MIKKIILVNLFLLLFFFSKTIANVTISVKINDVIITNQDIKKESLYLMALNKELERLDKKSILAIAKESIIRETIKKIELSKYYILDQKNPHIGEVIKDFYLKLNLQNEIDFQNHLQNYDLTLQEIKKKIEIEATWNDLIDRNYNNLVKINKENLIEKIEKLKNNNKKSYLLSEIMFEKIIDKSIENTYSKIKKSIEEIGFENTANIYSISDSSKFGGKIGWIEEASLAPIIKNQILELNINDYTKPILVNSNYLILKLQDTKNETTELDKNLLLKNMINYEYNRQLSNYSKIYYNKIKINTQIYEF
jgi:peptidyl-prolyl cis-trans isomerase SurA